MNLTVRLHWSKCERGLQYFNIYAMNQSKAYGCVEYRRAGWFVQANRAYGPFKTMREAKRFVEKEIRRVTPAPKQGGGSVRAVKS